MAVVRLDEQRGLALCVDAAGARHTVEIALVEPLAADRVVLVHAGVAIAALPGEDCPPAGTTSRQPSALPSESHHRPAGATSLQRSTNEVAISAAPAAAGEAP
jgi:hydrogenase maturation factor